MRETTVEHTAEYVAEINETSVREVKKLDVRVYKLQNYFARLRGARHWLVPVTSEANNHDRRAGIEIVTQCGGERALLRAARGQKGVKIPPLR